MKIEMPTTWQFKTELEVRITDLNYGNHLANQQFLAFAQEARLKFFKQFGFTELDFGGTSLIQADAAITYKSEGHLADCIEISICAIKSGVFSFNVYYSFWNKTKKVAMADIRTALVSYDYSKGKPIELSKKAIESGVFLR